MFYSSSIKAFLVLMPVLGVTFSLGLFVEYSPVVLGYIHVCVNGLTVNYILTKIMQQHLS